MSVATCLRRIVARVKCKVYKMVSKKLTSVQRVLETIIFLKDTIELKLPV